MIVDGRRNKTAFLLFEILDVLLLLWLLLLIGLDGLPAELQAHVGTHAAIMNRLFVVVKDAAAFVIGSNGLVGRAWDWVCHQANVVEKALLFYHHRVLVLVHLLVLRGA